MAKKGPKPKTLAERFWPLVSHSEGCWLWLGAKDKKGYGRVQRAVIDDHESVLAHRCAWELAGRTLTPGLTLDHLCRNRACVRVDHLEEVPSAVNTLRGEAPTIRANREGRCMNGHAVVGDNAARRSDGNLRCVTCHRERMRAYYEMNREKIRSYRKAYRAVHGERLNAYVRAWRVAHPNYSRELRARKASNGN